MNISTVNEIIASLESAGELSIKERKYLELAKAYLELAKAYLVMAAENVGLKAAISAVNRTAEECELNGDELKYVVEPSEFEALTDLLDETPATSAYLAGIKADGVALAKSAFEKHIQSPSCYQDEMVGMESALSIACQVESQLREGAK